MTETAFEPAEIPWRALTKRARKALKLAQDEARGLGHDYLGTEHILLGLMDERDGVASEALGNLGVTAQAVRSAVEVIVGRGIRTRGRGDVDLTPRAARSVRLAADEARQMGHDYVGTEHLLLGLVREGEGIAAGVLQSLGVGLEQGRASVVSILTGVSPEPVSSRSNVITCRINGRDLEAIDVLVEAGIRSTRSDAGAWLIHAGIQANADLLGKVHGTVAEIRRLRDEVARSLASEEPVRPDSPEPDADAAAS